MGAPVSDLSTHNRRNESRLGRPSSTALNRPSRPAARRSAQDFALPQYYDDRRHILASADTHGILDKWASAWSSHDVEVILRLFTDDCIYEDVPTGAINSGKDALRGFAQYFFVVSPDFKIEMSTQFNTETRAAGEFT